MQKGARIAAALAAGSAFSGVLAYVFFALTTRALGAAAAAPVSVLWTYWSFSAAALTFPVQHWIARSVAAHRGEGYVRRAIPRVTLAVLLAAVLSGLLAWLGRNALFHRGDVWFPLFVACVTIGSGFLGVVRGALSARRRFVALSWALLGENAIRCVGVVCLMLASVKTSWAYGLALFAGQFVGLFWPSSLRLSRDQGRTTTDSHLAFLGGASGGQLISQVVLTGGPVVLALSGGSATEVTALFAGLALFRAPYTLALGLVAPLTGRFTRLIVEERRAALRRVRIAIVVSTVLGVALAAVIGAEAGPPLLRLIFGSQVKLDRELSMLVAVGSAVSLANLVLTVAILAQNRGLVVARVWVAGLVGGGLAFALIDEPALTRTCLTFVVAEAVAFGVALFEENRGAKT